MSNLSYVEVSAHLVPVMLDDPVHVPIHGQCVVAGDHVTSWFTINGIRFFATPAQMRQIGRDLVKQADEITVRIATYTPEEES